MNSNLEIFLKKCSVEKVYFCSGSRNSSLLDSFKDFEVEHHYNEYSASFMALGEAKYSKKPVAICVTSGTAVSQCLSAMVEAYHSNIKLIVISADRPLRLKDSFAAQTINQETIFKDFIRLYIDEIKDNTTPAYPMHINLRIDDAKIVVPESSVVEKKPNEFKDVYLQSKKPLVIFSQSDIECHKEFEFFYQTGANIYSESLVPRLFRDNATIRYDHTCVKMVRENKFDLVIKVGNTPVSKVWRILDNESINVPVVSLCGQKMGLGRGQLFKQKVNLDFQDNKDCLNFQENNIEKLLDQFPHSEFAIIKSILLHVKEDHIVFVGNSMPIRYVEFFKNTPVEFIASRGASGIDGQIATAVGIAQATQKDVDVILGDITFLYDLASLTKSIPKNLKVHVLNNRGGRIFNRIGLTNEIVNEHDLDLTSIVKGFGLESHIFIYEVDNSQTNKVWELL